MMALYTISNSAWTHPTARQSGKAEDYAHINMLKRVVVLSAEDFAPLSAPKWHAGYGHGANHPAGESASLSASIRVVAELWY